MSLLNKTKFVIESGRITGDALVFWENDDFYAPGWIQFCADNLKRYDMIGEGRAIYYNVLHRYWHCFDNMSHSSLCSTAVRTGILDQVKQRCGHLDNHDPFLDQRIWLDEGGIQCSKRVFHPSDGRLVIGIKGMPGRGGYNVGHGCDMEGSLRDPGLDKLRSLIGNDAELYRPFYCQ